MSRQTGTILWFHNPKGWGFARFEDGREAFVHFRNIEQPDRGFRALKAGDTIEAELEDAAKGLVAKRVHCRSA